MLHSCAKMQVASNRPSLDWGDKLFCLVKVKKKFSRTGLYHAGDALAKFPTNAPSEVEEPVYTKSFNVATSIRRSGDPAWSSQVGQMGGKSFLKRMPDFCRKEKPYMLGTTSCVSRCGGVLCTHSTLWRWRTVRQTNNRGFASSDMPPCEGRSTNAFLAYIYLVLADKPLRKCILLSKYGAQTTLLAFTAFLQKVCKRQRPTKSRPVFGGIFLLGFYPFLNVSLPCLCAKAWFVGLNLLYCHLFVSASDESLWGTVGTRAVSREAATRKMEDEKTMINGPSSKKQEQTLFEDLPQRI